MAAENGGYVLQTEQSFYINPPGTIIAPAESGVVTIARLSVVAERDKASQEDLEVAYLTRGWARVENRAGVDFPDAKITLVAGSPNRAANIVVADRSRIVEAGVDMSGYLAASKPMYSGTNEAQLGFGRGIWQEPVGDLQSYPV